MRTSTCLSSCLAIRPLRARLLRSSFAILLILLGTACELQPLYIDDDRDGAYQGVDCDDQDPAVYPGALETCNGSDDDCDGDTDEDVKNTYYEDADSDSYGNSSLTTQACNPPSGYVEDSSDCNDVDDAVSPDALEICNDRDDDCDSDVDDRDESVTGQPTWYYDGDGDGYGVTATARVP